MAVPLQIKLHATEYTKALLGNVSICSATPKEAATAALLAAAESLGKQSIEGNEGGAATVEVQLLEG